MIKNWNDIVQLIYVVDAVNPNSQNTLHIL